MANTYIISGGKPLHGEIYVSGAKNSALPILAATILTKGTSIIHNIPYVSDVFTIIKILQHLGVKITRRKDHALICCVQNENHSSPPYNLVKKMRASICLLGPLLAKRKKAEIAFPGGCVIGKRPIDLHLKGMRLLGAEICIKNDYIKAKTSYLKGNKISLATSFGPTVLGTANVMMAAVLAKGKTIIQNAACEPEIEDLAMFLAKMGANITGIGSNTLEIYGVSELQGTEYQIIPDRMEAGTFMIATAATKGTVLLHNVQIEHLTSVTSTLKKIGVTIKFPQKNSILIEKTTRPYKACNIETSPYPGFPTDLQAQITSLLATINGKSSVKENIYPNRFAYVEELNKLGASICKKTSRIEIEGVEKLYGGNVSVFDLRAGASLVIAGLISNGKTCIKNIHHIQRGYEDLYKKLSTLGADIKYK